MFCGAAAQRRHVSIEFRQNITIARQSTIIS